MITLGELLHGTDEDFVTNLYLGALGRWPDEVGFAHHLQLLSGQPGLRAEVVRRFLHSEEAQQRSPAIRLDQADPVPVEQALAAQLRLRTEVLRAAMVALQQPPAVATAPLAAEITALAGAVEALRTELTERIAALEARLAGAVPPSPALSPAVSLDYVNDLVEGAQAPLLRRIRALEARLLAGEGGLSGS